MRWPHTKWSSAPLWVLLLGAPATARAGACCVGSVTSVPTRLGECEKVGAGFTLGAEHSASRWDRDGSLQTSSVAQDALLGTLGAAYRFDRNLQVGLTAPMRANHFTTDSTGTWGGGLGDLRMVAIWDPLEERPNLPDTHPSPVPIFSVGLRAPTGRDWTASSQALGEDITGLEQPAAIAGVSVERTLDRWPWSLGTTAEVGVGEVVQPTLISTATLGRTLGNSWTAVGIARHQLSWASLAPDVQAVHGTHLGARIIHGRPVRWRVFAGAETSLPVAGLGAGAPRATSGSIGAVLVR